MNAIHVSVKTNTVLVCKDLAEAQFRCMECSKAFISEKHLAKHNLKRHGFAPYYITGFEQADQANENERKLSEVTGRLEMALSLLEAKTSSFDSTTSHNKLEDTVRENSQAVQAQLSEKVLLESPQKFLDVRRTVSMFTLPYDRACEPVVDGWMTQSANEGMRSKIDLAQCGDNQIASVLDCGNTTRKVTSKNDDTQNISIPNKTSVERQADPDETPDDDAKPEPKSSPEEMHVGSNEDDDVVKNDRQDASLEPLLITLIKKLDTVFTGNRIVTNSCCQTSEPEVPEPESPLNQMDLKNPEGSQLEYHLSAPGRKSVRFSDLPMYYASTEQHFNQSESDCNSRSSGSNSEEEGLRFVENNELQTYTNYSAQSHVTRPVYHQPESAGETRIVCDPDGERTRVLESCPGQNEVDASGDSCHSPDAYETSNIKQDARTPENEVDTPQETEQSCTYDNESEDVSRSRETAIAAAEAAASAEVGSPGSPQPLPSTTMETNAKVRQSADYVATKKQILDIVEKCVKDLKAKRKQPMSPTRNKSGQIQDPEFTNSVEMRRSGSPGVGKTANQELPAAHMNSSCKASSNVICIGNGNITSESQGISPPCTMICKDEELDIDELSGDSYERFMKRFYSRVSEPEHGNEQLIANYQRPDQPCDDDQRHAGHRNHSNYVGASSQNQGVAPQNQGDMRIYADIPSKESDLKKTDYAVLLHHETSQVQSLIDTLVLDLQRWRNARRDHLSHAIRLQLEERLATNLSLLGIQSNAKLLTDSAAATAHFLLNNRRSKSAKVQKY